MKSPALCVLGVACVMQQASAVVVHTTTNQQLAPDNMPYFGNVVRIAGSSGIYLGNRWVLTANHVATSLPSTVLVGGNSRSTQSGSWQRLQNPSGYGLSTYCDLVLFQLAEDPLLPMMNIASSVATVGTDVMFVAAGRNQASSQSYWNVAEGPSYNDDVWSAASESAYELSGYGTINSQNTVWGMNEVAVRNIAQLVDPSTHAILYATQFNNLPNVLEAQAVSGDSGGAVLVWENGGWALSGVIEGVITYENQPIGSYNAIFGQYTLINDLSFYSDQIINITAVPEASSAAMLLMAIGGLTMRRRVIG